MPEKNLLHQGIHEPPPVLRRLVEAEPAAAFSDARRLPRRRRTRAIRQVGHGPSENAACYSVYSLALLADSLARASGLDADKPSRRTKVTLAP
jgi:hypothetical protein